MIRIIRLCALLLGGFTLALVGLLACLRHTPPDEVWLIFKAEYPTTRRADLYRVLTDGSHLKKLTSVTARSISIFDWERPGWLSIGQETANEQRLSLIHLTGHEKVLAQGDFPSVMDDYFQRYYDADHDTLYIVVPFWDAPEMWILDLQSGAKAVVEMPSMPSNYRGGYNNGGYVFWSDDHSDGDLYRFQFGNPPTVTRLTTRGDVSRNMPPIYRDDWVYFYTGDTTPPAAVPLYRIRPDGSDVQLVAERVLLLPDTSTPYSIQSDTIYYWGGNFDNPQFIEAKSDGSHATPLPIRPFGDQPYGFSPDNKWLYYRVPRGEDADYFAVTDLWRVNLQTGESFLVLENQRFVQSFWTGDDRWMVLVTQEDDGKQWLYRVRPDGSEFTQLGAEMQDFVYPIPETQQLVFRMWTSSGMSADSVYRLHTLDLDTMEIRTIPDHLPPMTVRSIVNTLPMPEYDWQPAWLGGGGVAAIGLGLFAGRWRRGYRLSANPA